MKKILFIVIRSILILSFLGFPLLMNSCKDSLGIEDNVKMYLLDSVPHHIDTVINKQFDSCRVEIKFVEREVDRITRDTLLRFNWNSKIDKFNALIDTSKSKTTLWFNIDAENPNTDSSGDWYQEVKSFNIEMDSVLPTGHYNKFGGKQGSCSSSLTIIDRQKQIFQPFYGNDSPLEMEFLENTYDGISGVIKMSVLAVFPSFWNHDSDFVFKGTITIRYFMK